MLLNNHSIIAITGASSGIGAALALELAPLGLRLALCARRQERLSEVANQARSLGAEVLELCCDVSIQKQATDFVELCITRFGGIDVLINNAGRGSCSSVEDTTEQELQSIFALNVFSLWYTSIPALRVMKQQRRGRIINVASMAAKIGYPYNSSYVSAKHAVVGMTASLRAELYGTGVQAQVVCPSGVETEWATATEHAPIGDLFAKAIRLSRTIAQERGQDKAPLKPMISAQAAARSIIDAIKDDDAPDLYTHEGTYEQAVLCAQDRPAFEYAMAPLYLGMQKVYPELARTTN